MSGTSDPWVPANPIGTGLGIPIMGHRFFNRAGVISLAQFEIAKSSRFDPLPSLFGMDPVLLVSEPNT